MSMVCLINDRQENAIRRKRQERDARLKKQSEKANKKRKRAEEAHEKERKIAKLDGETKKDANFESEQLVMESKALILPISRSKLPDLLPDEYLQDDSESEEAEDHELEVVRTKPRTMTFGDLVVKKPKDRRKGSTTYRVSELHSKNLAPKSSFYARSTKESWLKGRAGKGAGGSRKVVSGGFFKKS